MIKAVHIKNFQSHKDSRFEFHEGLNVVLGVSDSGKTVLIRAVDWVLCGKPCYPSHWGGDTVVTIETDRHTVSRFRTKQKVYYELDGNPLKATGRTVPEEVISSLNMTDINIQRQKDAPFLLSLSDGAVARLLNQFANLSLIDKLMSLLRSKEMTNRAEREVLETNVKEMESTISSIDLERVNHSMNRASRIIKYAGHKVSEAERLRKAIEGLELKHEVIIGYKDLPDTQPLSKLQTDLSKLAEKRDKLKVVCSHVRENKKERMSINKRISVLEKKRRQLMPDRCVLCGQQLKREKKK